MTVPTVQLNWRRGPIPRALRSVSVVSTALLLGFMVGPASAGSGARLTPIGIGSVRFGVTQSEAVASLKARFGAPTASGINTACGSRYTEVVWGDLAAEFREHRFTGYRYLKGGYPLKTLDSPHERPTITVRPRLSTSTGITLGSTLAQLRSAYPSLRLIGASKWRAANGLVFVDNAERDPPPPLSRVVEIKISTCGDF